MVNSTWTRGHVSDIWKTPDLHTVYPPCDVTEFTKLPLSSNKQKHIVSVAQFRPEKDHQLQVNNVVLIYIDFLDANYCLNGQVDAKLV